MTHPTSVGDIELEKCCFSRLQRTAGCLVLVPLVGDCLFGLEQSILFL